MSREIEEKYGKITDRKKHFVSFKMCEKEDVRRRMWVKRVRRVKGEEERECKGKRRDKGEKNGGEREDI